jgi:cellobiose phosphorylase
VLDPSIPSPWRGFEVVRKWRGATYKIIVKNPKGVQKGVTEVTLNGHPTSVPIPPQKPLSTNEVVVTMG